VGTFEFWVFIENQVIVGPTGPGNPAATLSCPFSGRYQGAVGAFSCFRRS
jgi:hypothetical protein